MGLSPAHKSFIMIDEEEPTIAPEEKPALGQEEESTALPEERVSPEKEATSTSEEDTPLPEESVSTEKEAAPSSEETTLLPEESAPPEPSPPKEEAPLEDEETHVDFDLLDTEGRWLLKVISGPNTGAEFAMHSGSSYLLGTDSKECDIVFQDLSVSRKHARLTVDVHEKAALEDLNSRNGTFINGEKITTKEISGSVLVSIGTTSFMLYDKEAERTTIITPLLQEKKEELGAPKNADDRLETIHEAVLPPLQSEVDRLKEEEHARAKSARAVSSLIILAIVTGFILLVGVGTLLLFRTEEILTPMVSEPDKEIKSVLADHPAIKYSFNPTNNKLMLVGHVLTVTDRTRLIDALEQLAFVQNIDSNNVVIDELVWRETNQLLSKNPAWRGISLTSPSAGRYLITGFLRTRNQASDLFDYLSLNFPYMDLLEKKVIIEEDLISQISRELVGSGFRSVIPALTNGELTLTGTIGQGTQDKFQKLVSLFKSLPGIRNVNSLVNEIGQKETFVDLTEKYRVTGYAKSGRNSSVVINGRILAPGDVLDGILITDITSTTILLEKDGVKYKIDFNR